MVTQVLTRDQFYAKYPNFAAMGWNDPERDRWLKAHPGAAAQWTAIRDVEQQMTKVYGENWRTTAGEQWSRATADYLDGGFGDKSNVPVNTAPGTAGSPTTAPGAAPAGGGTAEPAYDRNAYAYLTGVFESYGLGSLAPVILGYAQQGYTNDTIEILIRDTPEYKKRFAANDIRQKKGLNAIPIGQYLQLENDYAAILKNSGLPAGFYDNKEEDFANWIAGDVSPAELTERVTMAQQSALSSDPSIRQALALYYNIGEGDLTAYFLDPKRATTLFDTRRTFGTAAVGAEGMKQGLTVGKDRAQYFADQGVDQAAARQGFGNVAMALPDSERLSSIYDGADVGQSDLEDEFLSGNATARKNRTGLASKERATFSGKSGVGKTSLTQRRSGAY